MKPYSFRAVIIISIILFLCASFAQARLQAITEEDLADVTAESGITIGLDMTVRVSSGLDDGSLWLMQDSTQAEGFRWSDFIVGANNINNPFPLSTNVVMDVGSSGTKTWLNISGLVMPGADNELRIRLNNTYVRNDGSEMRLFDDINLLGLHIGRATDKAWGAENIHLVPSAPPFIRLSNSGNSGIEIQSEMAVFLNELRVRYAESSDDTQDNRFNLNDVYVYGHTNFDPLMQGELIDDTGDAEYNGNPVNWNDLPTGSNPNGQLYGNAKIGGYLPTYTYDTSSHDATVNGYRYFPATIDVGSSGTTTLLRLNLPSAFNLKIARVEMGDGAGTGTYTSLGSHILDNVSLYKLQITLRNTY